MRWANEHPEQMAEIAALPPSQQNAALRAAIGYDPDYIRDQYEEQQRDLSTTSTGDLDGSPALPSSKENGPASPVVESCSVCGAPADTPCASGCEANRA